MPLSEKRELSFGPLAICTAFGSAAALARSMGLPPGAPIAIHFTADGSGIVLSWGEGTEVSLPSDKLAAFLVAFCIRTRIPMPRGAEKTLRLEGGMAVLCLALTHDVLPEVVKVPASSSPKGEIPQREKPNQMVWKRS